jgi:hypothetical protein
MIRAARSTRQLFYTSYQSALHYFYSPYRVTNNRPGKTAEERMADYRFEKDVHDRLNPDTDPIVGMTHARYISEFVRSLGVIGNKDYQ